MSEREWAPIVYGRSFHLDFRFITLPQNFSKESAVWASRHIIATTQQARNLSGSPRWSLFKNHHYCVIGVTCMVRDLIGQLSEDMIEIMSKDDQGRPLYVFVGYVTQVNRDRKINNFPAYAEKHLDSFKILYREIEKVWLIKNYERNSTKALISKYQSVHFSGTAITTHEHQVPQLNHDLKYPNKVYLWPSLLRQNNLLWGTSMQSDQTTSICLNIKGKILVNSPFLNQTSSQLDEFQISDQTSINPSFPIASENPDSRPNANLSKKISNRAKEDIDLTLQQAAKVASVSQEFMSNLTEWSSFDDQNAPQKSDNSNNDAENFGFKTKKPSSSPSNQDWF